MSLRDCVNNIQDFDEIRGDAKEIVLRHLEDQGCLNNNFDTIKILQPHLFEWIEFFNFREEDLLNEPTN